MSVVFLVLAGLSMVAALATLFVGLGGMAGGGEFNRKYGNKLMRLRVLLQGLALAFLAAALLSRG